MQLEPQRMQNAWLVKEAQNLRRKRRESNLLPMEETRLRQLEREMDSRDMGRR